MLIGKGKRIIGLKEVAVTKSFFLRLVVTSMQRDKPHQTGWRGFAGMTCVSHPMGRRQPLTARQRKGNHLSDHGFNKSMQLL